MAGLGFARKRNRRNIADYEDVTVPPADESREAYLARYYERRHSDFKHGGGPAARRRADEQRYRKWRERNPRPPEPGTPDHYPPYETDYRRRSR